MIRQWCVAGSFSGGMSCPLNLKTHEAKGYVVKSASRDLSLYERSKRDIEFSDIYTYIYIRVNRRVTMLNYVIRW